MHHRRPAAPHSHRPNHRQINRLMPFTTAPLFHALQLLETGDSARFHMPGHKGEPVFNTYADIFAIDFTETYGTGNLYTGEGPIRDAEVAAARYFGSEDCFFLTGGSTQGILAMLGTAVGRGGAVLLDREVHKSVCYGCALLGITPYFFSAPLIEPFAVSGSLPVKDAEAQLIAHPEIKAILLTSPTYYGIRRAIPEFADLCRAHSKLLLVDGAHGAHFPAVGLPTPVAEGADMAVLSMHKTLPCMGQGAVLLSAAGVDRRALRENTMLFGTSSPSYPIMASIDLARAYTEGPGHAEYRRSAETCAELRTYVQHRTMFTALTEDHFPALDPCRLTVCTAGTDITGHLAGRYAVERMRRGVRDGGRPQCCVHPHRLRPERCDQPSETRSAAHFQTARADPPAVPVRAVSARRARDERARRMVLTDRQSAACRCRGSGLRPSGHAVSARCAAALARRENYRSAHCTYP